MLKPWKLQPREARSLIQVTQLAKGQLSASLLPGPLPISGGWMGQATCTEASLCSIRELLAAWGNPLALQILRSTFFHLVKAQIAFPPPPFRAVSNGYSDSIPLILRSREEQRPWTHLSHWKAKPVLTILETSSSLGHKILGSAVGERQRDNSESTVAGKPFWEWEERPGAGASCRPLPHCPCPLPDFASAGAPQGLQGKRENANLSHGGGHFPQILYNKNSFGLPEI